MPFLIPVLVGISVLFGGRYVIYIWCIKPRKTRNREIGIAIESPTSEMAAGFFVSGRRMLFQPCRR
jgi:hypothetical protein